jgi:hypothetical protein
MKTQILALTVITQFMGASGAAAQEHDVIFYRSGPPDAVGGAAGVEAADGQFRMAGDGHVAFAVPEIQMLAAEPFEGGKTVAGAPYSAEITTEIVQQLADGNRIERHSTSSVARDSEGRVRRDHQVIAIGPILPKGDAHIVTIHDPVAKVHYSLDAGRKVAVRLPAPPPFEEKPEGHGPEKHELLRAPSADFVQAAEKKTEALGTKEIEGVMAEGTRVTVSIPAGAIGNLSPIDVVSERWYSKDLQTVVYSRRSDPRFGETTYRLTNIVRAEPPADLFQIPADYRVEQPKELFFNRKVVRPPVQ